MATGTGTNVSKVNAYAVLWSNPGTNVSKANAYAVLGPADPPVWSAGVFASGATGIPYSSSVPMTSGTQPVTFTLQSGAVPAGLTLSSSGSAAVLGGTPTAAGIFTFGLRASNAFGFADKSFTVTIAPSSGAGTGGSYSFIA